MSSHDSQAECLDTTGARLWPAAIDQSIAKTRRPFTSRLSATAIGWVANRKASAVPPEQRVQLGENLGEVPTWVSNCVWHGLILLPERLLNKETLRRTSSLSKLMPFCGLDFRDDVASRLEESRPVVFVNPPPWARFRPRKVVGLQRSIADEIKNGLQRQA